MNVFFAFLILAQPPLILASGPKSTGEKATEKTTEKSEKTSRHINTVISQKSIQNVLKTVEILKKRSETAYRQKKNLATKKQSI